MTSAHKIRQDLRQLKINTHAINVLQKAYETHKRRIKMLEGLEENSYRARVIKRERAKLASLRFEEQIEALTDLELKYMHLIESLPALDKSIIVDCFINGKSYWQIGLDLGFSEEGIRKKVGVIIKKLAVNMDNLVI